MGSRGRGNWRSARGVGGENRTAVRVVAGSRSGAFAGKSVPDWGR
jgi:hypothetical protein